MASWFAVERGRSETTVFFAICSTKRAVSCLPHYKQTTNKGHAASTRAQKLRYRTESLDFYFVYQNETSSLRAGRLMFLNGFHATHLSLPCIYLSRPFTAFNGVLFTNLWLEKRAGICWNHHGNALQSSSSFNHNIICSLHPSKRLPQCHR